MKKSLLLIAAMLVITSIPVMAATITQTKTFSGIPGLTGALGFNQFNSSLGTLTSIQVTLNLQTNGGELRLDNDGENAANGNLQFGAYGSISSGDVALLNSSFVAIPGQVNAYHSQAFSLAANVGDSIGDYDSSPPDGMLYTGGTEADSKSGFIGNFAFAGYTGSGTYNINYSVSQWISYGSIGGIEYAVTPVTASGGVTVVYDYKPVPEPMTIGLLSLGALSVIRKRKIA
jgi:hypothetical protein